MRHAVNARVAKGKEAAASSGVLAATFNALTASGAAAQYPMAQAERVLTGETLSAVLTRYRAGKASSDAEVAPPSAIEWKAVQAIKAASRRRGEAGGLRRHHMGLGNGSHTCCELMALAFEERHLSYGRCYCFCYSAALN